MGGIERVAGGGMNQQARPASRKSVGGFSVPQGAPLAAGGAPATVASASAAALGCMLSVQEAVEEATQDREARRRGRDMLRTLSELQRALLTGETDAGALRRLVDLTADLPVAADAALGAAVRAITLRARVELARHGM